MHIQKLLKAVLGFLTLTMVGPMSVSAQTEVSTTSGTVRGLDGPDVISFRGIPFAEPPIGALRWAKPDAKVEEPSVIVAKTPAPACTQVLGSFQDDCKDLPGDVAGAVVGTEDCLTLDVWQPTAASAMPRPVMVWIHGGALTQGCTKIAANSPLKLALAGSDGTVVVSIQYRLGAMGYFSSADLSSEDTNGSTGNYGLLDQLMALQWVQDNIAAFGGDPNNVTIFGESAGATSVCALLASPLSDGLFQNAIAESGGCAAEALEADPGGTVPASGYEISQSVAVDAGCAAGPGQLACLRATSNDALVSSWGTITPGAFGSLPLASVHIDGHALDEMPAVMLGENAADGRPTILGSNANEMTIFTINLQATVFDAPTLDTALRAVFGDEITDAVAPLYPIGAFASPADAFRAMAEDLLFVCPQTQNAATLAGQAGDAYLYHYLNNPLPALNLRSFHGLELYYVFDTLGTQGLFLPDAGDSALVTSIQDAWASFAETGAPSTAPAWPLATSDPALTPLLQFDTSSVATANSTSTGGAIRAGRCSQIEALNLNPDHDLVVGAADNCPDVPNSLQGDANGNGIGDACETVMVPSLSPVAMGLLMGTLTLLMSCVRRPFQRARSRRQGA